MFAKIFLKEWRENILIFCLALLLMLALVLLSFTEQRELTLNFSGMFLLLFLPFAALLIGSGGFYSEFKDNAWIYLFSRPIRKEIIWIFKYVSLLSILLVIFGIFFLVKQFLPGLDEILRDINFPTEFRSFLSFSLYFVVPILAFTISFSISLLYEKQFVIFFVSVLIGTALAFIYGRYVVFLWNTYYYYGSFKILALFIALSFILASVLTLLKSDFSQIGKKILTFSKFTLIFLILSFGLGTFWVAKGNPFSRSGKFYSFHAVKHQEDFYFATYSGKLERYNSETDRVEKLSRITRFLYSRISIGGEKIAFFKVATAAKRWFEDLWIIDTNSSQEKVLVEASRQDSPFHNLNVRTNCLLSPDGDRIAFVTAPRDRRLKKIPTTIWWMNTDGTCLKSQTIDFPPYKSLQLMAWPALTNSVILGLEEMTPTFKTKAYSVIKVDLEKGVFQTIVEDVRGGKYKIHISPKHNCLAYAIHNLEGKDILAVLDLKTLEKKEVFKADKLKLWGIKWNQNGDKLAFSRGKEIWVYSLAENRIRKISVRNYGYEIGFDWLADGEKIVLYTPEFKLYAPASESDYFFKVLREDFSEEKSVRIPFPVQEPVYVWGLKNKVLVRFKEGPLWRVDLETEEWKKVF